VVVVVVVVVVVCVCVCVCVRCFLSSSPVPAVHSTLPDKNEHDFCEFSSVPQICGRPAAPPVVTRHVHPRRH